MVTLGNNETWENLGGGRFAAQVTMSAGTADLQMALDGVTFQDISNASWSASGDAILELPRCTVRATLTGDATLNIKRV